MLKSMTTQKSLVSSFVQKLIHPALIRKALLKLPFKKIQYGSLSVNLGEETHRFQGQYAGTHAELMILHPFRTYWLLKTRGELGFAQAYYEGAVDTNSLQNLLRFGADNQQALAEVLQDGWGSWLDLLSHRKRHNSLDNSRDNISYHYDLGNDFYRLWLDSSMTYSSGLFLHAQESLQQAQYNKYQRILDQLQIKAGDSILEVGCGWGGFMEAALERGAKVKGLTLSTEQRAYALQRLNKADFAGRYEVALQDYRLEDQQYDHIVSIEMFEAVGKEYWDSYFSTLYKALKPGGKAVLQVITIDDAIAESYQSNVDFIQKYIFPGGLLPSLEQLQNYAAKHGFSSGEVADFGLDYAKTCQIWKHEFNQKSSQLKAMGFDRPFQRLWNYYLDYCYVGFDIQQISVVQLTLHKSSQAEVR